MSENQIEKALRQAAKWFDPWEEPDPNYYLQRAQVLATVANTAALKNIADELMKIEGRLGD